ncbi:MAG: CinA family nicotinamide mononucleotide deamidase-related protein [Verrucomicrobiota bacterium]|nr:CinA family nicotinamide mononucleotide deamidase-related protein [Verrucomicrobiota bacterium]
MRVIVINTGTELLLGDVLNTHLVFIARAILPLGLRIDRQVTVPDGTAIRHALAEASRDSDIIFVTGGLGPTTDDITREAAAELRGVEMRRDEAVASTITARLARNRYPMTDRILRQADVPEGAIVLPNDNGTAPGLYFPAGSNTPHLFLLPGPPRELHPMFRESVLPILRGLVPSDATACRVFGIACVGESMVEAKIGRELLAIPNLELGYCAHAGAVDVRVMGPLAAVERAEEIIASAFRTSIYTQTGESLEQVVVRALIERNETVTTAESCTGGFLAHRLTNVPGASAVFLAGAVTYSNEAKARLLGVAPLLIEEHGAVSEPVVRAMAEGARAAAQSTYALATTGIAGPGGGTDAKPVGTVFIALASDEGTQVQNFRFITDRQAFKQLATQRVLEMLRRALI